MITHENNKIYGYASVFDVIDQHKDLIKYGAFSESVSRIPQGKKIPLLWQHKFDQPIGVVEYAEEDEYGLYIKAKIVSSTSMGKDICALISSGVINGLSIGYQPKKYSYPYGKDYRQIEEIDLLEISLVTFPANEAALVTNFKNLVIQDYSKVRGVIDYAISVLNSDI